MPVNNDKNARCPDANFFGSFVRRYLNKSNYKIGSNKFGAFFGKESFLDYLDKTQSLYEKNTGVTEDAKVTTEFLNAIKNKEVNPFNEDS